MTKPLRETRWLLWYFCPVATVNPKRELLTGRTKSTVIGKLKLSPVTVVPSSLETVVVEDMLVCTEVF